LAVCYISPAMSHRRLPPVFQQNDVLFGHDGTIVMIASEVEDNNWVKRFARKSCHKAKRTEL